MKNQKHIKRKYRGPTNLHNPNDDDGGFCWAPCDANGHILTKKARHITPNQDAPKGWKIVSCNHIT